MSLLSQLNQDYLRVHVTKEDAFWSQKMGLAAYVPGSLESAEIALHGFTNDERWLPRLLGELLRTDLAPDERTGLLGWQRFFEVNLIESPEAKRLQNDLIEREGELERSRGAMKLGYDDPETGHHVGAD